MRVLIVGVGIAGPTLAYWLLRAGHEVTLVEQAPELRRGGYLVDFRGAGFDVADRMGIVPELRRRGYVMAEARAVDRDGHRIASFTPPAIMGSMQRYVSIARSDLAAVLDEQDGGQDEHGVGGPVGDEGDQGGSGAGQGGADDGHERGHEGQQRQRQGERDVQQEQGGADADRVDGGDSDDAVGVAGEGAPCCLPGPVDTFGLCGEGVGDQPGPHLRAVA